MINIETKIKSECIEVDNMVNAIKNRQQIKSPCRLSIRSSSPRRSSPRLKTENQTISSKKLIELEDLCRVCEQNKKSTYIYGPGVCNPCRSFFFRGHNLKDNLECTHNDDCFGTDRFFTCRKCRLDKCLSIGMKMPNETINQTEACTIPRRFSLGLANTPCVICYSRSSQNGFHYGIKMCRTCARWYSSNKKHSVKISRLKCVQKDKTKINRCYKSKELSEMCCRKCRLKKIQDSIRWNF